MPCASSRWASSTACSWYSAIRGSSRSSPRSAATANGIRLNRVPPIRERHSAGLRHLLLRAGDDGPGQPAEPLVERDVHAVREPGDPRGAVAQVRRRLPDPRPVEVERDAALAAGAREGRELVPGGQEVARVAQRQLQQGCTEASPDRVEVLDLRHGRAVGEQVELEPVQQPRAVELVLDRVRERRDRHPSRASRVAPDPQHRLLGHDPAGEHRGRGLVEQRRRHGPRGPRPARARRSGPTLLASSRDAATSASAHAARPPGWATAARGRSGSGRARPRGRARGRATGGCGSTAMGVILRPRPANLRGPRPARPDARGVAYRGPGVGGCRAARARGRPMSRHFEELDWQHTEMGEISLRRRLRTGRCRSTSTRSSSVTSSSCRACSRSPRSSWPAWGWPPAPATSSTSSSAGSASGTPRSPRSRSRRVRSLVVVEALAPVIGWHEKHLLPDADVLTDRPARPGSVAG